MRPLVASLDRVVRSLQGPGAQATHTVFGRWVDLVGASVAAHATPIKIERERLLVSVDEPGWATQLRYLEADLVAKLMAAGVTLVGIDFRVAR
jgi:predicted nucleic acid-binding Zn ribbon protein